uniref:NADH-ubiquinone oxidoreductase chain 4L n=1 Tax=Linyphia triangularis TaxID=94031 RepID=A0A7M4C8T6_LINTI|nr:NADH dehydrogenase subunit 4L [Linyphia triangularis]
MTFIKLMVTMSFLSICWWRKNIIFMLLSLEMLLMSLFILLMMNNNLNMTMSMLIMVTIMVSGSSIGLAFLVALSRSHNSSNCTFIWNMT